MPKFLKELGWRFSLILIGVLLSPVVSRFIGEQYPDFIKKQPRGVLAAVLIVMGAILVAYLVIKRISDTRKSNIDREVPDFHIPFGRQECFAYLDYKRVTWPVLFESDYMDLLRWQKEPNDTVLRIRPERIAVHYPCCPKCGYRLDERDTFFGRYRWKCPKCNFSTRNRRNFYFESKRATLLAREEFERVKAGKEPKLLILRERYAKFFEASQKAEPNQ